MATSHRPPGEKFAPSYQISGKPFVTSSVANELASGVVVEVTFPSVTSWVVVENTGTGDIRLGFSENGLSNGKYFLVEQHKGGSEHADPIPYHFRCKRIFLTRDDNTSTSFSILAGLTDIPDLNTPLTGSEGVG